MKERIVAIIIVAILACVYLWGYRSGYNKHEAEINKVLVETQQAQAESTNKISQLVKREKELLLKIKEKDIDCEAVLNFDLRRCFK